MKTRPHLRAASTEGYWLRIYHGGERLEITRTDVAESADWQLRTSNYGAPALQNDFISFVSCRHFESAVRFLFSVTSTIML